jgi:hypothetical protein
MRELQLGDVGVDAVNKVRNELLNTAVVGNVTTYQGGKTMYKRPIKLGELQRAMAGVKKARKRKWG